jgi:hypothetical protein
MIRLRDMPDDDDLPTTPAEADHDAATPRSRRPRGAPATPTSSLSERTFYNPAQVAEMWGVSHDKVLEFIKTGELEAFNVASKKSRRPQFKIPLAALQAFQQRRSGRDPARSLPPPAPRRASRKPSASTSREYF